MHFALHCYHRKDSGVFLPRTLNSRSEQQLCINAGSRLLGKIRLWCVVAYLRVVLTVVALIGSSTYDVLTMHVECDMQATIIAEVVDDMFSALAGKLQK